MVAVEMMRIGKTVLLKGEDGTIKMGVVQGHDPKGDAKRVSDFGIVVDVDALKTFIGITETEKKPAPKRQKKKAQESIDEPIVD